MKKEGWKKYVSVILSAVLIFSSCLFAVPFNVQAMEPAVVFTAKSDKTQVQRGDTVTVSVDMTGNKKGGGLTLELSYDKEHLEYVEDSLIAGDVPSNLPAGFNFYDLTHVEHGNKIHITIVKNEGVLDNGSLFQVSFKVKDSAKGKIEFPMSATLVSNDVGDDMTELPCAYETEEADLNVYIPVTGIKLSHTQLALERGASEKMIATIEPADADQAVIWNSSNPSVATVSKDGTVTAVKKGTATITAKAGNMTADCRVKVNVPLESIEINAADGLDTIKKGQTLQLSVSYTPEDADGERTVDWSSSNEKVAKVSANGLVTALADGKTTITAKSGGKTASYEVTVQEIKLTSIAIKESTTIHKGENETLSVTYNPVNTTDDRTVKWSSSDASVATVDGSGNVTAVRPGQAQIKAQVGNFTAECLVTVDAPLKEIIPSEQSFDLLKNQTAQISWTLNPSDTTDSRDVMLESSDRNIVEVEADGTLIAKKAGTAVITLSGANNVKATVSVKVTEIPINGISLNVQNKTIEKNESFELKATIGPSNNTDDDQTITWKSSDSSVLTVQADSRDSSRAIVTATGKGGTATVTAVTWNGVESKCMVKVLKHIESIVLPQNIEISRGKTTILPVTVLPEDTDDVPEFRWTSSDPQIASVDEATGTITAKKAGKAVITVRTVSMNSVEASTTVNVAENHLTKEMMDTIVFSEMKESLLKNQSFDMNALLNLWDMLKTENVTDDIFVAWNVDDEAVASIDQSGRILGLKEGKVKVNAEITAIDGNGNKQMCSVSTTVSVKEIPLESIVFDKVISEMQTGATDVLHVLYNPKDTTDNRDVFWSSSDESIISVENGKLTAKKAGKATITAKVGDKTVSCTIMVKDAPKTDQNETTGNEAEPTAPKTGSLGVEGILLMLGMGVVLLLIVFLEKNKKRKIG